MKYTLWNLYAAVNHAMQDCERNNKNPEDVPVYINESWHKYPLSSFSECCGDDFFIALKFYKQNEIKVVAPDSRPEDGEYWRSRGIGFDLSGFVVSKLAGERLRRMVRLVLETDEPKSWLDYRESEPTWIQFKFQKEEFDLERLDELARANGNILTLDILKECKVINKMEE